MVVVQISTNLFIKDLLMPWLKSFMSALSPEGKEQKLISQHFPGLGETVSHPLPSVVPHRDGDLVDKVIVLHFAIWFDICFPEKIIHCNKSH